MGWTFVYLMVVLKIPVLAAIWIIWWAVKEPPVDAPESGSGGSPDRDHPRTGPPRPPRRGPHGDPPPQAPERVRLRVEAPDRTHAA